MIRINGETADHVAALNRGLQYGDGLFETIAVAEGRPEFWERHIKRLTAGCARLGIAPPDPTILKTEAGELCAGVSRGVLKIMVTRGVGGRGYAPPRDAAPTRILFLHPWPESPPQWRREGVYVRLCHTRLGLNPGLAGIKHLNRLEQVLARAEWEAADIAEGLMLDSRGRVIEGTRTNLFLVREGGLITPALDESGVAGIIREVVLEIAAERRMPVEIRNLHPEEIADADEAFLTNSIIGLWPIRRFDGTEITRGPVAAALAQRIEEMAR
jgi:4-amino-4-deoxychorismate lyase